MVCAQRHEGPRTALRHVLCAARGVPVEPMAARREGGPHKARSVLAPCHALLQATDCALATPQARQVLCQRKGNGGGAQRRQEKDKTLADRGSEARKSCKLDRAANVSLHREEVTLELLPPWNQRSTMCPKTSLQRLKHSKCKLNGAETSSYSWSEKVPEESSGSYYKGTDDTRRQIAGKLAPIARHWCQTSGNMPQWKPGVQQQLK